MRYLQLTRRRQILWAAGALGLGTWILVSAAALLYLGLAETAVEGDLERQRPARLAALSADKAELTQIVKSLEDRLMQAERQMKTLAGARAGDETRLAELSAENAELVRTVDRIADHLAQAEQDKEALATARAGDEARLAELSAEKVELARTVNSYEERLAQAKRDKEALAAARAGDEARLGELSVENAELVQTVDRIGERLAQAERDKEALATATSALQAEVAKLNQENAEIPDDVAAVLARLDGLKSDLKLATERAERAESQRGFYAARAARLESRLDEIAESQNAVVRRLSDRALRGIDMIRQIVEKTGIDVNDLLPEEDAAGLGLGQGGPFIAAEVFAGELVAGDFLIENDPDMELQVSVALLEQQMSRWEFLQNVIGSIPLTSPLDQYRLSSRYGRRKDPVNGRTGMHFGLDMAAPMRTPVMATVPGTVIFAGWKTGHGRVVELDHGNGIQTFYGHLRKILVERGQEVAHRETIGLLGSSGRSTGPHVHYEIQVNGTPYDPMKFLKAGRDALKG